VTALHTGYLVAGVALLTGTVLAVALLGALRRRRPAIPARAPANQVAAPRSG
jgi:hypothetical protein